MPKEIFFEKKCDWSKVKDNLLCCYLTPYFQKMLSTNRLTWYVDAFAGAGRFATGELGSPLMALKIRDERIAHSHVFNSANLINMIFIEPEYTEQLRSNVGDALNCEIVACKSEDYLDMLLARCAGGNLFLYYDPFGVRTFDFDLLNRLNSRRLNSVEILMNFNAFGFFRDACRVMKVAIPKEMEYHDGDNFSKEIHSVETLNKRVGGDFWMDVVRSHANGNINGYDAEKQIAEGFVRNLRKVYKYVLNIPMRVPSGCPKYRMIHVTRHADGWYLMATNMQKRKDELDIGEHGEQQLSLFETCVEGKYVSETDIEKWMESLLNGIQCEIRYTDFLALLVDKNRLINSFDYVKEKLKEWEKLGRIQILRHPALTKKGKKSIFWDEAGEKKNCDNSETHMKNKVQGYIKRKSMLYVTGVEYGDYTMNHVQGCAHGCKYPCYAFMLKRRFGQVHSYEEWLKPYLVSNTLELLDKEIPRLKHKIKSVQLSFSTDPFMYGYKEVCEMSMMAIRKLNEAGIKCVILTKGKLPEELSLYSKENEYGITLISLDEKYRQRVEPHAAPFSERLAALKQLHDAGCYTWVSMEPYPTPNLIEQDLQQLLASISFVDKIIFGRTNYSKEVSAYGCHRAFYNEKAQEVIAFCKKHGISYHIKDGTLTPDNI